MPAILRRMGTLNMDQADAMSNDRHSTKSIVASRKHYSRAPATTGWVTVSQYSQQKAKINDLSRKRHNTKSTTDKREPWRDIRRSSTLLFHIPLPPGPMTVGQITETIVFEGASDAWFAELLPRYGHEQCYDLAVQSLALASWAGRGLLEGRPQKALETMGRAITALQSKMKVSEKSNLTY